jgi:homoprotocatechuate degradation regulator HpaR
MSTPKRKPDRRRPVAFAHRNLPLLLLQAREGVLARFRPILNAHGLTEQQWRILRALLETGPLEPRQIGRLCGISSPSMAGILARMEALDLIHRERLEHDQRRVRVTPSARSQALARQMAPQIEAGYAALAAQLGPDFVEALYGTLDHLVAQLGPGEPDQTEAEADRLT